jgi:hypothetical protein
MRRLFAADPTADPSKIRRWAIRMNWDASSAVELEAIARAAQREVLDAIPKPQPRYQKKTPIWRSKMVR